jgi:hypothetical protein
VTRRLVKVAISFDFVTRMVTEGWIKEPYTKVTMTGGVPKDAKFVRSFTVKSVGYLVFSHPSFKEVGVGESIPIMSPIFHEELMSMI